MGSEMCIRDRFCCLFVSMLHYRPRLLLGFVVCLFQCCTTDRGCCWVLLFVCFYVALQAEVVVGFCCLFVSMLHYRPRLLVGFVVCLFLCCTTDRGCWWILLFVCFNVALQAEVVGGFCCLFVSMLHYRPRLLVDLVVCLFLCCTTGRGCWWVLFSVCFYVARQAEVVGGSCCLFVSMLHDRPRLLVGFSMLHDRPRLLGFVVCLFYMGLSPLFPTSALHWFPQTVCARCVFKETVKDYLIFQSISITGNSFIDFHKISAIDIFYSIKIT